jgi:clan AA aspartic protease
MIQGRVNAQREAIVRLIVHGPGEAYAEVDAIVDSGFAGSLTLPADVIESLGLVRQSGGGAVLADGSVRHMELFAANVEWEGEQRPILVSAVGEEPLLGMRLLEGYELKIAVEQDGVVEITPLQ